MGYLLIEDFSGGLDVRKSEDTAEPGTLRQLTNAFVNSGGQIEKRKTFTSVGVLPVGTLGLAFADNTIIVFGNGALGASMPDYTEYREIVPSDGAVAMSVVDVAQFGEHLTIICEMDDGTTRSFYFPSGGGCTDQGPIGSNARAHGTKMYWVDGKKLRFSAVGDASDLAGTGSGLVDVATYDARITELVGLEKYYNKLALLGRTAVQIWATDPDPAKLTLEQSLANIGLVAPNAVAGYGSGDLLFLSHTGVRSLRARDASNAAVLNDIGSPIDPIISDRRARMTPGEAQKIKSVIDPLTGQYWLVWGRYVYVLAYYPNSRIEAWSVYDFVQDIEDIVVANSRIVVRTSDELFVYGSVAGGAAPWAPNTPVGTSALYDASPVVIRTPFLDHGRPATDKTWHGLDVACTGVWDIEVNVDPNSPAAFVKVATVSHSTYNLERVPLELGDSTHISIRLTTRSAEAARIGTIALHNSLEDAG